MRLVLCIFLIVGVASGCGKSSFLDKKPSSSLVVPQNLKDFQALLDYSYIMNVTPSLGELSSDNYFLSTGLWSSYPAPERGTYIWAADIYDGIQSANDWSTPYQQVFIANQVLEGLEQLPMSQEAIVLKGASLFFRAHAFYQLAQVFAPAYDKATGDSDLGLPLKLTNDISTSKPRSSVAETYAQIITDLNNALELLPERFDIHKRNRPSKPAAYGMLARVYLVLQNYELAKLYSDSLLGLHSDLIDFNTVPPGADFYYFPFDPLNEETIFQSSASGTTNWYYLTGASDQVSVDTVLYNSYAENDLRRNIYFFRQPNGSIAANASYGGSFGYSLPFSGIATDEFWLLRAECFARAGKVLEAMSNLNLLLEKRFVAGSFVPYSAADPQLALNLVLLERRKELVFRGRWQDLRRLNKEGANITLVRVVNGTTYTVEPGSPLYTLPIPAEEILSSGIIQNQR